MGAERQVLMMKKREQTKMLMNELSQGKELAQQLKTHLDAPSSPETRRFLAERILSCYEKALSLLNFRDVGGGSMDEGEIMTFSFLRESPASSKDQHSHDVTKKRKASMPQWTEEVRVAPGATLELPMMVITGESTGRKTFSGPIFREDTIGARTVMRKDVWQRNRFRGRIATRTYLKLSIEDDILVSDHLTRQSNPLPSKRTKTIPWGQSNHNHQFSTLHRIDQYSVKTEKADNRDYAFPCFTFHTTPVEPRQNGETSTFTHALEDNYFIPGTPEPGYFSMSTLCPGSGLTTDTEMTGIVSAPASVTNSPITDVILPLDKADVDPSFLFDDPDFFLVKAPGQRVR